MKEVNGCYINTLRSYTAKRVIEESEPYTKPLRLDTEVRIESNNNHSEMGLPVLNALDIIIGSLL